METKTPYPFTPAIEAQLVAEGYKVTHIPAHWEDDGDAENGPHLTGHEAYDEWVRENADGTADYAVMYDGAVAEVGKYPDMSCCV